MKIHKISTVVAKNRLTTLNNLILIRLNAFDNSLSTSSVEISISQLLIYSIANPFQILQLYFVDRF